MLKLALCDDEAEQRAAVSKLLRQYAALRPELTVKLSVFSSGLELLSAAEEGENFDLYVLDVVMPGLSGIDLGVKLRELGHYGAIVYLSISPEYAVESYTARAFHYLMKPVEPAKLFQVLDQAAAALEKRKASCVTVKTREGLVLVPLDRIMYVELNNRAVRYHLSNNTLVDSLTVRTSFQEETAQLLQDSRFFQSGASFAVNLYYVAAVERSSLRLDNGERVPLARGRAPMLKQRWSDYWLGGQAEEQV